MPSSMFGLQDAISPTMSLLTAFHDYALIFITLVLTFVAYMMFALMKNTMWSRSVTDATNLEIFWTVLPTVILVMLAIPSLRILYMMDEVGAPSVSVKSIGHQWYWTYEYSDYKPSLKFDSFMVPTKDLKQGEFRLLEVDHRAVFPYNMQIRMLISSADVIHAWTVPALGVKVDAIPGRINQVGFMASRPGVYYGQCSEICGANHTFMPIAVELVNKESYTQWVLAQTSHSD